MKPKIDTTRRLFFSKAGAVLSAPLAVAAAGSAQGAGEDTAALKARLDRLEDVNALREVNRAWTRQVNAGAREELAGLFADPEDLPTDYGIRSVSADGVEGFDEQEVIEISADRSTATARIPCTVQMETPIEPACPLVDMAREQGGGVIKRTESGVFENRYVRQDGVWKMQRAVYRSR